MKSLFKNFIGRLFKAGFVAGALILCLPSYGQEDPTLKGWDKDNVCSIEEAIEAAQSCFDSDISILSIEAYVPYQSGHYSFLVRILENNQILDMAFDCKRSHSIESGNICTSEEARKEIKKSMPTAEILSVEFYDMPALTGSPGFVIRATIDGLVSDIWINYDCDI